MPDYISASEDHKTKFSTRKVSPGDNSTQTFLYSETSPHISKAGMRNVARTRTETILQSQTSNQYSGPTTLPQLLLDWVYVILTHWGWYPAEHYKYCLKKSSTLLCLACSLLDRDIKFLTVSGLLCPLCQNMLSFQSAKISGLSAFYSQRH